MQIAIRGSGPPLVMLHGWAMHGGIFEPLVARLESAFTLHIVDLPGHGASAHSTVPFTLDAVAREVAARTPPALWLGWSLGGLIALHAAQVLPDSVHGLAMLCASPRFVRSERWPQGMDTSVFSGFANDLARDYRATIDRFLMLEAQGSDHVRDDIRLLREQVFAVASPDPARLVEGLALLQESDLREGLPTLSMPSLWLVGRRDRLVSPAAMRAAAALAPGSHFVQFDHGGHAPFLSHAIDVAGALIEFSATLPA